MTQPEQPPVKEIPGEDPVPDDGLTTPSTEPTPDPVPPPPLPSGGEDPNA